jgi:hypothetical protein
MVSRWRKPGNCIFRGIPRCGAGDRATAPQCRWYDQDRGQLPPVSRGFLSTVIPGPGKAAGTPDGLAGAGADG